MASLKTIQEKVSIPDFFGVLKALTIRCVSPLTFFIFRVIKPHGIEL